ncbi:MAG: biopolymer transporter ExbD [Elusimicrobia bacterium]|nr:biopolymer transporter ExbD [Elusimicrobiota bacterium]
MRTLSDGDDPITEINVTPLVDVSLVLVIIFMAVSPLILQAGIKAMESKTGAAQGLKTVEKNVNLEMDRAGIMRVNGKIVPKDGLRIALKKALAASKDRQSGTRKIDLMNKNKDSQKGEQAR